MLAHGGSRLTAPHRPTDLDGLFAERPRRALLRRAVRQPLSHGLSSLLVEQLPETASGEFRLQLLRTKFKPSRKLTGYYRLDHDAESRHLAVSWTADGETGLLVSPSDPAMPQLARLSTRDHLADTIERLTGRPVRPADLGEPRTVRYRPGQRHVLAVDLPSWDGSAECGVYVKTDRDDSGATAARVAAFIGSVLESDPAVTVAEPLGHLDADSAAFWWRAPGRPLTWWVHASTYGAFRAVHQAGRALRMLHDATEPGRRPPVPVVRTSGPRDEATATARAGEHVAALLPGAGATYTALLAEATERLDRDHGEPLVLCHGDLKCDNLLVHESGLRILDLDRARMAEPALDLGKLLADLRWWRPAAAERRPLVEAFHAGYGPCDPSRWARAELWAVTYQLRHVARRCAVHEPDWERQVLERVEATVAAMHAVTRTGRHR